MKAIEGKLEAWYKKITVVPKIKSLLEPGESSEDEVIEKWMRYEGSVGKIRISEGYPVTSFRDLINEVALVTIRNRQYEMFYRGQNVDFRSSAARGKEPKTVVYPSIYRPEKKTDGTYKASIRKETIQARYAKLDKFLAEYPKTKSRPIEFYLSIFQHYGITETPLIDITQSLRVAATFALRNSPTGYLYVFGLPYPNQSISHYYDLGIILIKLQNICTPEAYRPRYQEGFLVGRFPYDRNKDAGDNLARRLIAKYKLDNSDGTFWDEGFPPMPEEVLFPTDDPMEGAMKKEAERILKGGKPPFRIPIKK